MVAVSVVIAEAVPMFSVALAAWVSSPVPDSAVPTVSVLLLVRVTPVTVTLGMENVPVSACELVSKVYTPVPAVKVPLLVMPPRKVAAELPELFQVPPALIVTKPVNILVPVAEDMFKVPVVPPPTVVVPVTVKAKAPAVKAVPFPMVRLPLMPKPTAVAVLAVPLNVKLPLIVVVEVVRVLALVPERVRL